jgi:hypothetical protein
MSVRVTSRLLERLPPNARRAVLHRFGRFAPWEPGFDFTPPPLQNGEVSGPPDFVGIGTQKAGTTWWYSLIESHPGVTSRPDIHKERHFLSRFGSTAFTDADIDAYHGWFPRRAGEISGEWTPDYLSWPWVPPLLQRAAPKTRLLVILRDPVDRFRSGLSHQVATGAEITGDTVSDAVNRGFYHRHLDWWARYFDDDRMLVLQYELCARDPERQLAKTYRFLGLDDTFRPEALELRHSSTVRTVPLDADAAGRLAKIYSEDVARLSEHLPDLDMSLWTHFSGRRG